MTTAPDDPDDWGVLPVTAEIEIDGVRHSYTEGVTALTWQAGGEGAPAGGRNGGISPAPACATP